MNNKVHERTKMIFWCNRNEMKTFNGKKNKKKNLLEALADLQILTMRGFIFVVETMDGRHLSQQAPLPPAPPAAGCKNGNNPHLQKLIPWKHAINGV